MRIVSHVLAALVLGGIVVGPAKAQFSLRPVTPGQTLQGELTAQQSRHPDGSYIDCLQLRTEPGKTYTVTLRSSAFDAFLMASGNGCDAANMTIRNDDAGAGTTDSRVTFAGTGATFGLFVNTARAGQTGVYSLSVSSEAQASTRAAARGPAHPSTMPGFQPTAAELAGWEAYQRENYSEAARMLRPFAEDGNPYAQEVMGSLYYAGRGVPKNLVEAGRWYGLAADQGHEPAQRFLNQYGPYILEARFVDHIDRYGPDPTNLQTFFYDVGVYCAYRGPNCDAWQRRYRQYESASNAAAEQANMRRIWGLYSSDSGDDGWRRSRERSECMRRVTESIQRQTYGQQTWRYVNSC